MSLHATGTNANDSLQNSFHGADTTGANVNMTLGIPTFGMTNGMSGGNGLENLTGGVNTFVSPSCVNGNNFGGSTGISEPKNNQHSCTLDVYQCDLNVLDSSGSRNIKHEKY